MGADKDFWADEVIAESSAKGKKKKGKNSACLDKQIESKKRIWLMSADVEHWGGKQICQSVG